MADVAGPLIPIILHLLDFYGFKIRVGTLVSLQNQQPGISGSPHRISQTTKVASTPTKQRYSRRDSGNIAIVAPASCRRFFAQSARTSVAHPGPPNIPILVHPTNPYNTRS